MVAEPTGGPQELSTAMREQFRGTDLRRDAVVIARL
jgi:hypothetical protein